MSNLARAETIKTKLGQRLREIRTHFGDPDRDVFCLRLGISKASLGNYERGDRIPDSSVLESYRRELGVNINWLVAGDGAMFENTVSNLPTSHIVPPHQINTALLENLVTLAKSVHDEFGIKLPGTKATSEAALLYNELTKRVSNLNDVDEIAANIPLLRYHLKKRLDEAKNAPGTGKRQA